MASRHGIERAAHRSTPRRTLRYRPTMDPVWQHLLVAVGGGIGASMRWGAIEVAGLARVPAWAVIMVVNVLGCLLIGAIVGLVVGRELDAFVAVGLLGGFTTFSTAMLDVVVLWRAGRRTAAVSCLLATPLLGVATAWAGWSIVGGLVGIPGVGS